MAQQKVSLICTVFNEAGSLEPFFTSLTQQSRLPDEFVVIDGGSTDGTVALLQDFGKTVSFPVRVEVAHGANIARGRNLAIERSQFSLVAVTDAGCVLHKDWLQNIVAPLEQNLETMVVAGWYEPPANMPLWHDVIAAATFTHRRAINPESFLPSSRSIAFRKAAWEGVTGYPEWLTKTAEDTLFDLALRAKGYKQAFAENALVYWYPRPSLQSLWKQYASYGYGDAEAGLEGRLFRIKLAGAGIALICLILAIMIDWRWLLVPIVGALLFGYTPLGTTPRLRFGYLLVPIPKLTASLAQFIGYWQGLSSPRRRRSHV